RGPPAEQILFQLAAQENHSSAFQFIFRTEPTPFRGNFVTHFAVLGTYTTHRVSADHAIAILNAGPANRFEAGVFHQWRSCLDHFDIRFFKDNLFPSALATRLFARLLGPADDNAFAECIKAAHQNIPEAAAVSDEQGHGCDSPHDAKHGEKGARVIALQSHPGFANDFNQHIGSSRDLVIGRSDLEQLAFNISRSSNNQITRCFYPPASNLKASMGSTDAALRAGYSAESTAIPPSMAQASTPDVHVGISPAKKSGIGSRSTSQHNP